MFIYIDEQFVAESFFDSTKEIEYVLFALQTLDRMKNNHLDLVANNEDTINLFLEKVKEFYKNHGKNIPFTKPLTEITHEDILKPFLEKFFMDLYQVAIVQDINWEYKFINYNQLLSLAETTKTFNFGIDKIKITPEYKKDFGSIQILSQYTYWIIWSVFHATKYWAAKVIPSKILFEVNTYDNDCIPSFLCIIPFRTIIELSNNITTSNQKEINDFIVKYPNRQFDNIVNFAKEAANIPLCLEPTYYMDDVKSGVNHAIIGPLKAKFTKSKSSRSRLLPFLAAQLLVLYINGINVSSSLIPNYKILPWQKSTAAKKSVYENILNCFYFQDIFDFTASFFRSEEWKEIDNVEPTKIIDIFNKNKELITKTFEGGLVERWIQELVIKIASANFYESNVGLLSSAGGIGSIFVANEEAYNEHEHLIKNSVIVEDRISRIYNMMQALVSGVVEFRGYTAFRQTTLSGHAIRSVVTFINLIKGAIFSFNELLAFKKLSIKFDQEKLLDMILETFEEEKIMLSTYTEEYIGKLEMSNIFKTALKMVEKYTTMELNKPVNAEYRNLILRAIKIRRSQINEFFTSDQFIILAAFGYVINGIRETLTNEEMALLRQYNLDKFLNISEFEEYLTPEAISLIKERRDSSIVGVYSFINNFFLKSFFEEFVTTFVPLHITIKEPVLSKQQSTLLSTNIQPTFTILGQVEGEYSHRQLETAITTTDSFVRYLKACFDFTFAVMKDGKSQLSLQKKIITDLGFKQRLDGKPLLNKLPKFEIKKAKVTTTSTTDGKKETKTVPSKISNFTVASYNKAIDKYNKEQIELLTEYKNSIPAIVDRGYNLSTGSILNKPIVILAALGSYLEVRETINEINEYNNEQEELLYNSIRNLPIVKDLGFRHSIDGLKVKNPLPNSKNYDLKTINDIMDIKERINLFNNEQVFILESYRQNFPKVINYGFKNTYSGEFIDTNKILSHLDLIFNNYAEYKVAIKKVTEWNEYQEKILTEYFDNLPPINNYGFKTYLNGNPIKYQLASNITINDFKKSDKVTSKYFYDLNKEILQFGQEQNIILEEYINAIPQINDLGFKKRFNLEPLIYKKPPKLSEMRPQLNSRIAIAKYQNDIINFNDEQYNQLQKAIKNLEQVSTLDFDHHIDGTKIDMFKPIVMIHNINNLNDLEDLATQIHKWNILQNQIYQEALKSIPPLKDLGFTRNGQLVNSTIDIVDLTNLEHKIRSNKDYQDIYKKILAFNTDQEKVLEYSRFVVPKLEHYGFDTTDGAQIPAPDPNHYLEKIVNYESFIKMTEYINAYNEEQRKLLNNAIAMLPPIKQTHFEFDEKGEPVKHQMPAFVSSDIKTKDDYLDQLRWINLYNEEQSLIESNFKHILPEITKYHFSSYPDGTPVTIPASEVDASKIEEVAKTLDFGDLSRRIAAYNNEQAMILYSWVNKVPNVIDLGFDKEDGIDISKPLITPINDFTNEALFRDMIESINHWNGLQMECRRLAIEQIPELLELDILKNVKNQNRRISRPFIEPIIENKLSTKQDFINLIRDIKAYNMEQRELMISFINNYLEENLFNAGALQHLNNEPLEHPLPTTSYDELKTNEDINRYLEGVYQFSREQKAILDEYKGKIIPKIEDYGFRFKQDSSNSIKDDVVYQNIANIKTIREAEFMAKEIMRFNAWQADILSKNISLIKTINTKGFTHKVNGTRLIHNMPIPDPYSIKNDDEYRLISDYIRGYNDEQVECLEMLKQSIPRIEDYKIYNDADEIMEAPKFESLDKLDNYQDVMNYINKVKEWNRKQQDLLKKNLH